MNWMDLDRNGEVNGADFFIFNEILNSSNKKDRRDRNKRDYDDEYDNDDDDNY